MFTKILKYEIKTNFWFIGKNTILQIETPYISRHKIQKPQFRRSTSPYFYYLCLNRRNSEISQSIQIDKLSKVN